MLLHPEDCFVGRAVRGCVCACVRAVGRRSVSSGWVDTRIRTMLVMSMPCYGDGGSAVVFSYDGNDGDGTCAGVREDMRNLKMALKLSGASLYVEYAFAKPRVGRLESTVHRCWSTLVITGGDWTVGDCGGLRSDP